MFDFNALLRLSESYISFSVNLSIMCTSKVVTNFQTRNASMEEAK